VNIYQRLAAAMAEVTYIQKENKKGMNYSIVSHDAVTAKVRPVLLKNGIVYHPTAIDAQQSGNRTEVRLVVRFVNVADPKDTFDVPSLGYGIDAQDKGPGKAISYAVKYALLKAMGLETGDDPEYDQETPHEPAAPVQFTGDPAIRRSSNEIKRNQPGRWSEIERAIRNMASVEDLKEYADKIRAEVAGWPTDWRDALTDLYETKKDELRARAA
jgi:hypothetical protein